MHDVVKSVVHSSFSVHSKDYNKLLNHINTLASEQIQYKKLKEFIPIFIHIVNILNSEEITVEIAKAFNNLCMLYINTTEYAVARYWGHRAINSFKELSSNQQAFMGLGVSYLNVANAMSYENTLSQYTGKQFQHNYLDKIVEYYQLGIDVFDEILKEEKSNTVIWSRNKAINGLASIYRFMGKYVESIELINTVTEEKLADVNLDLYILENYYLFIKKIYSEFQKDYKKWDKKYKDFFMFHSNYKNWFPYYSYDFLNEGDSNLTLENVKQRILVIENGLSKKLFSLAVSCDMAADLRISYAHAFARHNKDLILCHQNARKWSNRAIYLCSVLFETHTSPFEGNVYSTAALSAYGLGDIHIAYRYQLYAIEVLEAIYFDRTEKQEGDKLMRAYNNMYMITADSKWKDKVDKMLREK